MMFYLLGGKLSVFKFSHRQILICSLKFNSEKNFTFNVDFFIKIYERTRWLHFNIKDNFREEITEGIKFNLYDHYK